MINDPNIIESVKEEIKALGKQELNSAIENTILKNDSLISDDMIGMYSSCNIFNILKDVKEYKIVCVPDVYEQIVELVRVMDINIDVVLTELLPKGILATLYKEGECL